MADVFTINGSTLDMAATKAIPVSFRDTFGAVPVLTLQRRGIPLPGIPDPWLGKVVTWRHSGTLYFTGDVVACNPHFDSYLGWVITYTCAGKRNRLDWFPHTDDATGLDVSAFNLTLSDPAVNLARSGRTVGQILESALQMQGIPNDPETPGNVSAITAAGMGNYVGAGATIIAAVTQADLAALTVVPPRPVYFGGEKLGDAIDSLLAQWAPNYRWWVDPAGNFRVLDLRAFASNTLTMGTDPVVPAELARDVSRCFQRVLVRGQPTAVMALLKLTTGDLAEDFAHDGLDNTAAKAAWTAADFSTPGKALSQGTISVTSTTTVTYTSTVGTETWPSGYWDQAHQQGTINLAASSLGGSYVQFWSARIVACAALTAGGTASLTLDNPLPNTNYNTATITGLATGASVVWTRYSITNSALWPRLTNQSTYPQAFVNASGTGATVLSSPMGLIFRTDLATFPLAYTFNTTTGKIRFIAPTYTVANDAAPLDVWIYQPVNTNNLYAVYPGDTTGPPRTPNYAGTSNTVDGLQKTLTVTIDQWTDPGQFGTYGPSGSGMQLYAYDLWSSVSDAVVEGEVTYYGFYAPGLAFGNALTVAGKDGSAPSYTTGWEGLSLPIREVLVEWPQETGQDYITTMRVSNRRDVYAVDQFLKPPRRAGYSLGLAEGYFSPMTGMVSEGDRGVMMPSTEGAQATMDVQFPGPTPMGTPPAEAYQQAHEGPLGVAGRDRPEGVSVEPFGAKETESDREMVQRVFEQFAPAPGRSGQSESPPQE